MRCALCRKWTIARRRKFGHPVQMSGRFCRDCLPVVVAAEVGAVMVCVEDEFSRAWRGIQEAA